MRFRVMYQWTSSNTANQVLVRDVLMPLALKALDKYFQVKAPETSNDSVRLLGHQQVLVGDDRHGHHSRQVPLQRAS
jgi:hypothetical protein